MTELPELIKKDKVLGPILPTISIPKFSSEKLSIEQALMKSIIGQQLSVKAAATIYGRFLDLFDGELSGADILKAKDDSLRKVGLSRMKVNYVKNVAMYFQDQDEKLLLQLSEDQLLKKLVTIKGVGEWTVQMVMMFYLHKEDVFPAKDLGIQIAMSDLFELDRKHKKLPEQMIKLAERWKPYRTWASLVLWRYKDLIITSKK